MRNFTFLLFFAFMTSLQAFAQDPQQRLALAEDESSRAETPVNPVRLSCAPWSAML
ncbi:hypothetical protein [Hymenobacter cellulosilyticus]|uniref:Uncharacterized protein n=1 Tax=Hymenobacter cellulosilyticus TaxID=2932248 RepID=A0A8T9QGK1_9BACT|nr:hypothetical protein [Hymenobacter cellulosilyticus]UOQ73933.1 hypothetical protein MUN79_08555 [Hymenobacter cellulosilyticus]